jgi:hypothetical protein
VGKKRVSLKSENRVTHQLGDMAGVGQIPARGFFFFFSCHGKVTLEVSMSSSFILQLGFGNWL